jgi:tRNA A-37 threonylcarbamoyl transferase component Bud32
MRAAQSYQSQCPHSRQRFSSLPQPDASVQGCEWYAKTGRELGRGKEGVTYQVCCGLPSNERCNYVIKHQSNTKRRSTFETKIAREIELQMAYTDLGLSVPVVDGWVCQHEAYIVMPKLDLTLKEYVWSLIPGTTNTDDLKRVIRMYMERVKEMRQIAHQHRLVHTDMSVQNMMVDVSEATDSEHPPIYLIDFGKAKRVESMAEADEEESEQDLVLTFDMLYKDAKAEWQRQQTTRGVFSEPRRMIRVPPTPVRAPQTARKADIFSPLSTGSQPNLHYRDDEDFKEEGFRTIAFEDTPTKCGSTCTNRSDSASPPVSKKLSFWDEEEEEEEPTVVRRQLF